MNDTTFKLRVPTSDLGSWKLCAEKSKLTLSEWIRRRCNGEGHLNDDTPFFGGGPTIAQRILRGLNEQLPIPTEWGKFNEQPHKLPRTTLAHHPRCSCLLCKPKGAK